MRTACRSPQQVAASTFYCIHYASLHRIVLGGVGNSNTKGPSASHFRSPRSHVSGKCDEKETGSGRPDAGRGGRELGIPQRPPGRQVPEPRPPAARPRRPRRLFKQGNKPGPAPRPEAAGKRAPPPPETPWPPRKGSAGLAGSSFPFPLGLPPSCPTNSMGAPPGRVAAALLLPELLYLPAPPPAPPPEVTTRPVPLVSRRASRQRREDGGGGSPGTELPGAQRC